MAGRSRGSSLIPLFYLLLIFVAPLAFLNTANAQDDQVPLEDDAKTKDLGTGELFVFSNHANRCTDNGFRSHRY